MVKINLLRERAVDQPAAKLPVEHKPIQGILVMVVLLIAAVAFVVWLGWSKYKEKEELRLIVDNLTNEAKNLDLEGIKSKMEKYQAKAALLKERTQILNQLKENQSGPKEMMQIVNESLVSNADAKLCLTGMTQTRDEQGNESLVITGYAEDIPAITSFSTNLQGKKYFQFVDLINVQDATPRKSQIEVSSKRIEFILHCRKVKKVEPKSEEKEAKNG